MDTIAGRETPETGRPSASAEERDGQEATKANVEMDRRFYGTTQDEAPAEAVDPAEVFRNES